MQYICLKFRIRRRSLNLIITRWRDWNEPSQIKLRTSNTPVSGALHDPRPFCQFKSRLIHGYHVKEHEKLHRISKKIDPFKAKKSYGGQRSDLGHFLNELFYVVTMNKPRRGVSKRPKVVQSSGEWCPNRKSGYLTLICRFFKICRLWLIDDSSFISTTSLDDGEFDPFEFSGIISQWCDWKRIWRYKKLS